MTCLLNGVLYTPYYIFLRCGSECSDGESLEWFGLSQYQPTVATRPLFRYVVFADDGQWKLIADDWLYTLWHLPSTHVAIAELGKRWDLFACSFADCDHSFDFLYFRQGELVRKYVVEDSQRRRIVVENFGEPFAGESSAFQQGDELEVVLEIARSLGIKTNYTEREIRVYGPPA